VPPLEGIDSKGIFTLRNVSDTDRIKAYMAEHKVKRAVIVGGGFIGLEMAENLKHAGAQVAVVEMANQVMAPIDFSMAALVHEHLQQQDVRLYLEQAVEGFSREGDELTVHFKSGVSLKAEEMEEKFPHVNAICQEIKTKYEYADADYMVVVPSGILDIITEGRALHHCVGSSDRYWDRIERRESFVMFLRKTDDPFHAYYTLEVEPDGTVRQKRTEYDRQKKDIEQATEFLQKWQRVITARLTESDKALAAESRILREKEFIQLKKDRVIIHTGHLAGRLLADVLMADLMENTDSIQSPALAAAA
jgi:tRNA A-37 threonylcarbamoyl transferase component Bud32